MPVMHKTLFGASIVMFAISVVTLGLVMQELSSDRVLLANRRAQVVIAMLQVTSEFACSFIVLRNL